MEMGYDNYALAQPPRHVPWLVRSQVLFGGFASQFGWLFFGFGFIFVWIFGLNADFGGVLFSVGEVGSARTSHFSSAFLYS